VRLPALAAAALVAVTALALPACGGEDQSEAVRGTLERFGRATAEKDYQTICDELFAPQLLTEVRQAGLPCEVALSRSSLAQAERPTLTVRSVSVDGDRASARIRTGAANQPASEDTVQLVRQDGAWRIVSLASPS
jgi:hypothetical protein